ncbi:metal-dependent transcriptional regulator [Corynebacterium argentoratense]|uniref:metal-dependent transcriptional regulator n=1 Tax=Corynebacterium argentoratense TaxID=42817 RepID=UPI0028D5CBC1|nr:metal-dependent transcriptional regulator [Corynebacterium argentoratense]
MHIQSLSQKTQDYLKVIWEICERTETPASNSAIADALGEKNSTVSEAIKRLRAQKLVEHKPYQGVTLTEKGASLAVAMVRRHRLIEMFLCDTLGYTWDEVHDEAEILEHAVSDTFLDRVDTLLGHPHRDPHGDPIPRADGTIDIVGIRDLSSVNIGESATVERIRDRDPELLRYLAQRGILPGVTVSVVDTPHSSLKMLKVAGADEPVALADSQSCAIVVSSQKNQAAATPRTQQ